MNGTAAEPRARPGAGYQAALLGGFTMVAAAMLALGNMATKDAIEERRAEDLLASLGEVIPPAIHDNDLLADPLELSRAPGAPVPVYRALRGHRVTGVAFPIRAQGYGGAIDLILGLDARGRILGVRVLTHAETPGLGDKIDVRRDDWIRGFEGLSLANPPAARWKVEKDGGAFDQFSGATITPRAVVGAIKRGLELFRDHEDTLLAAAVIQETPDTSGDTRPAPGATR